MKTLNEYLVQDINQAQFGAGGEEIKTKEDIDSSDYMLGRYENSIILIMNQRSIIDFIKTTDSLNRTISWDNGHHLQIENLSLAKAFNKFKKIKHYDDDLIVFSCYPGVTKKDDEYSFAYEASVDVFDDIQHQFYLNLIGYDLYRMKDFLVEVDELRSKL